MLYVVPTVGIDTETRSLHLTSAWAAPIAESLEIKERGPTRGVVFDPRAFQFAGV